MATTLEEAGISERRLTQRVEQVDDVETVLLDESSAHDLIILGEDDPGILKWLVGPTTERVAERTLSPVLVVQRSLEE
ncbi:MAG: universal stress protein [Halovenus sp.]